MKLRQYSSIGLAFIAAAGLMFAGCAKRTTVEGSTPLSIGKSAGTTSGGATTSGVSNGAHVSTVQEPSSHSVYFVFDSSRLDDPALSILDANAAWLNVHPGTLITVEGNCDQRGTREYNLALGQRRADTVKDYLVKRGVSSSRIKTVSFGKERPACKGTGKACWAQNRHADIVVR